GRAIERNGASDDIADSAEPPLPEGVAHHRDRWSAGTVFLGREEPSQRRADSQGREVARRHRGAVEPLGVFTADERELTLRGYSDRLERARLSPVQVVIEERGSERIGSLAE